MHAAMDSPSPTHHREQPQTKKRKLNRVKCDRCRFDKQNCTPLDRVWPTKCNRCIQKGFSCSKGERLQRKSKYTQQPLPPPEGSERSSQENANALDEWLFLMGLQKLAILPMKRLRELEKETWQVFASALPYSAMINRHKTDAEEEYLQFLRWLAKYTREIWKQLSESSCIQTHDLVNLLIHKTAADNHSEFPMDDRYSLNEDQPILDELQRHKLLCSEVLVRLHRLSLARKLPLWELQGEYAALVKLWKKLMVKATEVLSSATPSIGNIGHTLEHLGWFLRSRLAGILASAGIGEPVTSIETLGRTAAHMWLDSVEPYHGKESWLDVFKKKINPELQDIDFQDYLGRSLLHIACQKRWYCGIAWLLEQGADLGRVTGYGSLPIHYAAANGSKAICKLILSHHHKVEIDRKDNAGLSALDYATIGEYTDIVELLSNNRTGDKTETVTSKVTNAAENSRHKSPGNLAVEPSIAPVQSVSTVEDQHAAFATRSIPSNMSLTANILPASLNIQPIDVIKHLRFAIEYILSQSLYCDIGDVQVICAVREKLHWNSDWMKALPATLIVQSSDFIHSMRILVRVEAELRHASNPSMPMTSFEDVATHTMLTAMHYAQDHVESLTFEKLEFEVVERLMMDAVKGSL